MTADGKRLDPSSDSKPMKAYGVKDKDTLKLLVAKERVKARHFSLRWGVDDDRNAS